MRFNNCRSCKHYHLWYGLGNGSPYPMGYEGCMYKKEATGTQYKAGKNKTVGTIVCPKYEIKEK